MGKYFSFPQLREHFCGIFHRVSQRVTGRMKPYLPTVVVHSFIHCSLTLLPSVSYFPKCFLGSIQTLFLVIFALLAILFKKKKKKKILLYLISSILFSQTCFINVLWKELLQCHLCSSVFEFCTVNSIVPRDVLHIFTEDMICLCVSFFFQMGTLS